ncbi:hypothetical protein DFH09DRAFT_1281834 [Mycena vulgaris]|nr:hypothetical protein DFH09DRAFT_1281834 [Mycena vulgaris]
MTYVSLAKKTGENRGFLIQYTENRKLQKQSQKVSVLLALLCALALELELEGRDDSEWRRDDMTWDRAEVLLRLFRVCEDGPSFPFLRHPPDICKAHAYLARARRVGREWAQEAVVVVVDEGAARVMLRVGGGDGGWGYKPTACSRRAGRRRAPQAIVPGTRFCFGARALDVREAGILHTLRAPVEKGKTSRRDHEADGDAILPNIFE